MLICSEKRAYPLIGWSVPNLMSWELTLWWISPIKSTGETLTEFVGGLYHVGYHNLNQSRPGGRRTRSPMFAHACELGCEGIVSKRRGSRYRSGRNHVWLKNQEPAGARFATVSGAAGSDSFQ